MSNNNSTELNAWAREVCALHSDLARPLEWVSDPRLRELQDQLPWVTDSSAWEPADLGEWYFTKVGVQKLPACPLPAPSWGVERAVRVGEWPEVAIIDQGQAWESGESSARLVRETKIMVDALPPETPLLDENFNPIPGQFDSRLPGDVHESTHVTVTARTSEGGEFYVTVARAEELECVIGDALASVREMV